VAVDESTQGLEQETDALTGFWTRSVLLRDLEESVEPESAPRALGIVDLRGFLDLCGSMEAEGYLRSVARYLSEALEGARFYRSREDEFAVLVDAPADEAETRLNVAASTVNARLGQQSVLVCFGIVSLPDEANDPIAALSLAGSRHVLRRRRPRERRLYPRG
jgi:GGDEF domain-containing protein